MARHRRAFLHTWLTSWSPPGSRKLQDRGSEEVPVNNCVTEPMMSQKASIWKYGRKLECTTASWPLSRLGSLVDEQNGSTRHPGVRPQSRSAL